VGELNSYPLFAELAASNLSPDGRIGMVLKSALVQSPTWSSFISSLLSQGRLASALDFRNWAGWFPAVGFHERFVLLTLRAPADGPAAPVRLGFYLDDPSETDGEKVIEITSAQIVAVNPVTRTLPTFENGAAARLVLRLYERLPVLGDATSGWRLRYSTGFHMSSDSDLLRSKEELEAEGYVRSGAAYNTGLQRYIPLMEGKLLHQFDPRFASFERTPASSRFGRKPATWNPDEGTKQNMSYDVEARYWIGADAAEANLQRRGLSDGYALAFRDTTNVVSNFRTAVAAVVGSWCFNYKAPNLVSQSSDIRERAVDVALACALMNSFAFDYIVRQKFFGANLTKSILDQIAVPRRGDLARHLEFIVERVALLNCNHTAMAPFAQLLGVKLTYWGSEERFRAMRELDALFFRLYGFSEADVELALRNFVILNERDRKRDGVATTADAAMRAYRSMRS
jgi:hypothetical protein